MDSKQTPEIRFKGFNEPWGSCELSDVISLYGGKDYKHLSEGPIPVFGTGGYMLSVNEALSYVDGVGIGRKGTIDKPYILNAPFWTVDTLFYAIPKQKYDLNFIYGIFQIIDWKQKDESTGVPSLSKEAINQTQCWVTYIKEQRFIGSFFQRLDTLITLYQRKHDKLEDIKKAMLCKMFPRDGRNVPEIRFKGFDEPWEKKKLSDIGEIITGSTPSTSHPEYYSDVGIPWVTPTDITSNFIYDTPKKLSPLGGKVGRIVPAESILVTCIASIGKNTMLMKRGSFNQQINGIVPRKEKYDPYFLLAGSNHWSAKMKKEAAAATMQIVNKNEFSVLETFTPCLGEQKRIGRFFQRLDSLITLYQRKHDKLSDIKKAMLGKMFV